MKYTQNPVEPFDHHIFQLGDLLAYGVRGQLGDSHFFDTLDEAVLELETIARRDFRSYKRECAGKDYARRRLTLVGEYHNSLLRNSS